MATFRRDESELGRYRTGRFVARPRVRYQRFEIPEEKRACIVFAPAWGASIGEEMGRTRLMSGYFCKPGAEPLTNDQVEALVRKIKIDR